MMETPDVSQGFLLKQTYSEEHDGKGRCEDYELDGGSNLKEGLHLRDL